MLDIQLAIAKQRGLDLIGEAAADQAAARVPRFRRSPQAGPAGRDQLRPRGRPPGTDRLAVSD